MCPFVLPSGASKNYMGIFIKKLFLVGGSMTFINESTTESAASLAMRIRQDECMVTVHCWL